MSRRALVPVPTLFRRVVAVVAASLIAATAATAAPAAAATEPVRYQPPVDAPVVDGFRPPTTPYGPGNRGVDYGTGPGQPVRAAAAGAVSFAGPVAGSLHVVVLHPDGIRTSYSFLATVTVHRGDKVQAGQPVGTTGPVPLHFGARSGDVYVDPLALLTGVTTRRARLVPEGNGTLPPEFQERSALEQLVRGLRSGGRTGAGALLWAIQQEDGAALPAVPIGSAAARTAARVDSEAVLTAWLAGTFGGTGMFHTPVAAALALWETTHQPCTPADAPPPGPVTERRIALLVAGLGSTSEHSAITALDTRALGYAPADTFQFSYRGGTADTSPYGEADTEGPIARSGARLRDLLVRLQHDHPGVPIDVFAHSLGGRVARAALVQPVPGVARLITYGTPHQGTDLALVANGARGVISRGVQAAGRPLPAPGSAAVEDLGRGPAELAVLTVSGSPPPGVRVLSIAARGDVVVPAPRTLLPGAAHVVVSSTGLNRHGTLPGSVEARRETALALADRPPTCQALLDAIVDVATAMAVERVEDAAAAALSGAGPARRRLPGW